MVGIYHALHDVIFSENDLTAAELNELVGAEAGSFIKFRNELCIVDSVNPLKIRFPTEI